MLRKLFTVFVLFLSLGFVVRAQQTSMTSPGGGSSGGSPSFPLLAPDGLVSAPSYSFSGAPTSGLFRTAAGPTVASAGVEALTFYTTGIVIKAADVYGWNSGATTSSGTIDTFLLRNAAGIISPSLNGSLSNGWVMNGGGESALAGNYTNATAGFTSTNLTRTLISGRTYNFDAYLYITESTAVDGWQINFNANALGITNFVVNCSSSAETGIAVVLGNATSAALATVINATSTVTTGGQEIECHGSIVPSAGGVFGIQAAQNTHSTGTLTVKRGSSLILRDSPAL